MSDQVGNALIGMVLDMLGADGSSTYPGYGDAGVATLVLDLENGFTVKHSWITNVIKFRAGPEQRISRNDIDRESYSGSAYLSGDLPRSVRAQLARYAAAGSVFLLGLPHEALTIRADNAGETVFVHPGALALVDWAKPGQRVVVVHRDEDDQPQFVDAIVQSTTADSITLDVDPGALGLIGGEIMPAKAIYLAPQQNFSRFPVAVEKWELEARCAVPMDFAPQFASLDLGPLTVSASLDDAVVVAKVFGLNGNTIAFGMNGDPGNPAAGELLEGVLGDPLVVFNYKPGTTTFQDLIDALAVSAYVQLGGVTNPTATMQAGDEMGDLLTGGTDMGSIGSGAALTTYDGDDTERPVWDEPLSVPDDTIVDGVHAMTQIIDHGGAPYALGTADRADWFRSVVISGGDQAEWQWFKLFMHTVKGKQKKFWLPTWRDDLVYVSHVGAALTIDADEGDFTAWWPHQRQHVQIEQEDGTITYAEITAAAGAVLTLSVALSASTVTRISWLELCRFEDGDQYDTVHGQHGFGVSLTARVVP